MDDTLVEPYVAMLRGKAYCVPHGMYGRLAAEWWGRVMDRGGGRMDNSTVVNAVDPYVTDVAHDNVEQLRAAEGEIEHAEQWYDQSGSGNWRFPGPDVSGEPAVKKPPILIEPLDQGFEIEYPEADYPGVRLAFTDAVDLAEWLGEWLGLGDDPDWRSNDYKKALDVVEAAKAYVESVESLHSGHGEYDKLAQAVKKWCVGGLCLNPGYGELPYPVIDREEVADLPE